MLRKVLTINRRLAQHPSTFFYAHKKHENRFFLNEAPAYNPSLIANADNPAGFENCLSYALCIKNIAPDLLDSIDYEKTNPPRKEEINNVIQDINHYFNNNKFASPAEHFPGKLPTQKNGYYLAALFISRHKGINKDRTCYQVGDYHFLVQHNDGTFSHRRGRGSHPEKVDSNGNPILIPEYAKLTYVDNMGKYYDRSYLDPLPKELHYEFIGYIYFMSLIERTKQLVKTVEKQQPRMT